MADTLAVAIVIEALALPCRTRTPPLPTCRPGDEGPPHSPIGHKSAVE